MERDDWLAERFEANRPYLRAVAVRMLGSQTEADDAVQETWLRLSRSGAGDVENLRAWLTTVVARVCLDMLRSHRSRRERLFGAHVPEPIADRDDGVDPEQEALLADSVGLALLVVLDTLAPAERLAFVLHDMFDVPFDEIAAIVGRTPSAARQLASRARRRVQAAATVTEAAHASSRLPAAAMVTEAAHARRRAVVGAFLAASRDGAFDALLALLDPDVVVRADRKAAPAGAAIEVRGARAVAEQALAFSGRARYARLALVNGAVGIVVAPHGRLATVMAFTVRQGKIVEIDVVADPARLARLDLAALD